MEKPSYYELLKSPEWQKKRLEIMGRDEFTCVQCGEDSTPLHVHHTIYRKNHKPWEYDGPELITLCESCHERTTLINAAIKEEFKYAARYGYKQDFFIGFLAGINNNGWKASSDEEIIGMALGRLAIRAQNELVIRLISENPRSVTDDIDGLFK